MSIVFDKQKDILVRLNKCTLLSDYKKLKEEFKKTYESLKEQIESETIVVEKHKLLQEYKESQNFMNQEFERKRQNVFAPARWVKIEAEGDGPELHLLDCVGDFIVSDGKNLIRCPYLELVEFEGKYYLKQTHYPDKKD